MKQQLYKNIVILIVVNLLVKPLWVLGIEATVHNRLGSEVMGQFVALLNLSIVYQILLDLGLHTYNANTISRHPHRIKKLFPSILLAKFFLALIYLGVLLVIGVMMGLTSYNIFLLSLLCGMQILQSGHLYIRSNVVGLQYYKRDTILSVLDKALMIIICGFLLYNRYIHFTIAHFVYAQIISYAVSIGVGYFLIRDHIRFRLANNSWIRLWVIVKQGLPYALLIFVMSIYFRADVIILEYLSRLLNPEAAGVYFAKFRILDIANNMSGVLIAGFLLPFFSKNIDDRSLIYKTSHTVAQFFFIISGMILIIVYYYGDDLLSLLYTNPVNQDGWLLFLVMLSFPFYSMNYIFSTLITAHRSLKFLIATSTIAAIISIISNMIWVPMYGAYATATIAIMVHALTALVNYGYTTRIFYFRIDRAIVMKNVLWLMLLVGISSLMMMIHLPYLIEIIIIMVVAIVSSLWLRIIDITKTIKLFR